MDGATSVLLIEDDEELAELYRLRLSADGYRVSVVPDGVSGLAAVSEAPPDVVFLDVRLPRLSGIEVLEQIRSTATISDTPVFVLSNYGEPELRDRCLELGAVDYLVKADVVPATLAERVKQVTEAAR
ncbi:MAG: response regulator [Candidatus Dormibacteraeota bacterium]|nr:response regulator [Candidatus Dormibacteraeota bacterium]